MEKIISLDTAAVLVDVSKRTLWRWINDGKIVRKGTDKRGRAMLEIDNIIPIICIEVLSEDYELLTGADNNDPEAQNDLAILFLEKKRPDIALYWLTCAANNEHADAMHYLSELYRKGHGVNKCENTAMMWLAKAATKNHVIAKQQLSAWIQKSDKNNS